ncbi:MAG: aromatic amino acid transport family protein, partial [Nanoarchaeota archaeon]
MEKGEWFFNKKFWATTFTLTGTVIGAGILGLPYVFSRAGFFIGLFWVLFLGFMIVLSKLYLGEVILRTKETHQLPGYAERYLGKWGKRFMVFEMIFGVYSALIAYLIGEGQSFSQLFTGGINYSLYFALGFWLLMTFLLREGLRGLKKVESWGVIAILVIVLGMFIWYFPGVKIENLYSFDLNYLFLPFGVVLFALLGFSAIPEMKRELKGSEKLMKKAILVGALIPVVVYILFSFIFVATLGQNVP